LCATSRRLKRDYSSKPPHPMLGEKRC
jgi:hypothetical protein